MARERHGKYTMRAIRWWWCAALAVLGLASLVTAARANVTLLYFRAVPGNNQVTLEWATETEFDTAGFYVLRSLQPVTGFVRIDESDFVFAEGQGGFGAVYSRTDSNVTNGTTYYYKLEEIQTNNSSHVYPDLASAVPGTTPPTYTPTPTPTNTAGPGPQTRVPRPSATPTPSDTPTPSRTPSPTATGDPRTPTSTADTPTASPTSNGTQQPTVTPLPPGMVALTTATAAARETLQQMTAAPTALAATASSSTATAPATLTSGKLPAATATATPRPAIQSSAQPSRAPTTLAQPQATAVAKAQPGAPPRGATTEIASGTNWLLVGLVIGMFAAAVLLVVGAILILRLILSR